MAHTQKELIDWITDKASTAMGYRKNLFASNDRSRDSVQIGRMYFFRYFPKNYETLPKYDLYPLIFPLEYYPDGILGLNIHYLSIPERSAILGYLLKTISNKSLSPRAKLQISYDIIQRTRQLSSLARPCVKRYLFTQVQSKFIEIQPAEWSYVIELPLESFRYNP